MRKSMLFVIVVVAVLFMFSGLAFAQVSMSPDGKTCTPCHTDGRSAPAAKPAPAPTAPAKTDTVKAVAPKAPAAPKAAALKTVAAKLTVTNLSESKTVNGYKSGDKVLAPIRAVAESIGAKVASWDKAKKEATVVLSGKAVTVKAVKIVGGSSYADAAAYATSLGITFDAKTNTIKRSKSTITRPQWEGTVHNYANLTLTDGSPSKRDNCIACHDGAGFANQKTKRADLPDPAKVTGIDCSSCHSVRGKEIMNSGTTPILANGYKVTNAGYGALCITCHNGRKSPAVPAKPDSNSAPHLSFQSDILFGFGGYEFDQAFPTSPHGANPDTCVSCHMAEKDGVMSHSFKVEDAEASCGSCHAGLETVNRPALGDFDGDKVIEGIQDEVKGLLTVLEHALEAAVPTGEMHESHGQVYFADKADANKKVDVKPEIYYAAWNLLAVESDGSHGIHNPAYTIKLLQESYKAVTGKSVPNASLR